MGSLWFFVAVVIFKHMCCTFTHGFHRIDTQMLRSCCGSYHRPTHTRPSLRALGPEHSWVHSLSMGLVRPFVSGPTGGTVSTSAASGTFVNKRAETYADRLRSNVKAADLEDTPQEDDVQGPDGNI